MQSEMIELLHELISNKLKDIDRATIGPLASDTIGICVLEHNLMVGYLRYIEDAASVEFCICSSVSQSKLDEHNRVPLSEPGLLEMIEDYLSELRVCILTYISMWDGL